MSCLDGERKLHEIAFQTCKVKLQKSLFVLKRHQFLLNGFTPVSKFGGEKNQLWKTLLY